MKKIPLVILLVTQLVLSQDKNNLKVTDRENNEKIWVDSIYQKLTLQEKLGQLFMIAAYSNKDSAHINEIKNTIEKHYIGGLIFFQGGPVRQAKLTNYYQSNSKLPLFIGIDAEWGLKMRLDSTYCYPWNMTLGAIRNDKLLTRLGKQMAQENKRLGLHFNFAPVIDINTNPQNPIIGNRSFGEDKTIVTRNAKAYMLGLQSGGVLATGKHFPGHGDTDKDSHHTLPTVNFDKKRIKAVELYPYRQLFEAGLASVMVAHLQVPSLENREDTPTSLSYQVVTELLKEEMKFNGLIFTDALNMKGASESREKGQINIDAFMAGNDILLFAEDIPLTIDKFIELYQNNGLTEERLAHSVKKILKYKYRVGLNRYQPIAVKNIVKEINTPQAEALHYDLYKNAITVIKNAGNILPIANIGDEKIAYVKLGDSTHETFLSSLQNYAQVDEVSDTTIEGLLEKLSGYSKVIVGYHKSDANAWKDHEFNVTELEWLEAIANEHKVILNGFVKPYAFSAIKFYKNIESVIVSYQNNKIAHDVSAQIIFGALGSKGCLPVTINKLFPVDTGIFTSELSRLGFDIPENVGMSSDSLAKIDKRILQVIKDGITPGAQILVARKGKVVYHKSFGYHTYEKKNPVKNTDLYDVASLTKILSTLPNVMQSVDKKEMTLETSLGDLLPEVFKETDKRDITLKRMLSHNARLQAWMPFYVSTLDSLNKPSTELYHSEYSDEFSIPVAKDLYLKTTYKDTIITKIAKSDLLKTAKYKYSDFPFIILNYYYKTHNKPLDSISWYNFYKPLGAYRTTYNPLNKFEKSEIIPTEEDDYFRYQTIHGYVHDMGAAMEGGVGGHAGIFSNSLDVAKIMQLFLQKGEYGGKRYFKENTFDSFNTCYYCNDDNRRGVGFDKPVKEGESGPTCGCVSLTSFGHSGFTGTFAWADPETEIVYVFLSNRTYPKAGENRLAKENVRSEIQEIITNSVFK